MSSTSFQDRLNKVAEARAPIEASKPVVDLSPDWKTNIRYPISLVAAAVAGMAAVFAARYARFHLTGGGYGDMNPDATMIVDAGLAAGCSFLLFGLMRFEGHAYKMAQSVGIMIMVCIMHNFVHMAPRVFDTVFSPEWTYEVVNTTYPKSILFRGVSYAINPEEARQVAKQRWGVDVNE